MARVSPFHVRFFFFPSFFEVTTILSAMRVGVLCRACLCDSREEQPVALMSCRCWHVYSHFLSICPFCFTVYDSLSISVAETGPASLRCHCIPERCGVKHKAQILGDRSSRLGGLSLPASDSNAWKLVVGKEDYHCGKKQNKTKKT